MNSDEIKKIIGLTIRSERKRQKLSQDKLSDLTYIEPSSLSNIENGKSFPGILTLCKIINGLKIEPNRIFSFIEYEKKEINSSDLVLLEEIRTLPENVKVILIDLIKQIKK